jgi:hypothetical protein
MKRVPVHDLSRMAEYKKILSLANTKVKNNSPPFSLGKSQAGELGQGKKNKARMAGSDRRMGRSVQ